MGMRAAAGNTNLRRPGRPIGLCRGVRGAWRGRLKVCCEAILVLSGYYHGYSSTKSRSYGNRPEFALRLIK